MDREILSLAADGLLPGEPAPAQPDFFTDLPASYPYRPAARADETSKAAADKVAPHVSTATRSGTIVRGPWPDGLPDSWQRIGDVAARVLSRLWVDDAA